MLVLRCRRCGIKLQLQDNVSVPELPMDMLNGTTSNSEALDGTGATGDVEICSEDDCVIDDGKCGWFDC